MANQTYCLADQSFTNSGECEVVFTAIVRERGERPLEIGGFLVDLGCTGIKDALYTRIERHELEDFKRDAFKNGFQEKPTAWGRKLIEDALAYGKSLGLKPHRDYKKAARVLGGLRSSDCDEVFHFGRDGKPFYFQGIHSDAVARRMVEHLNRRLGTDGFEFVIEAEAALSDTLQDRVNYCLDEARAGRLKKANSLQKKLMEEHPEEALVHFARGAIMACYDNHQTALESFDRAIELNPEFDEAWFNKAAAHRSLGDAVNMIRAYRKVVDLTPADDQLHQDADEHLEGIAETLYENTGMTIDAFYDAETTYAVAVNHAENKNFEQAIQVIQDNPQILPTNERTLTLLGSCYRNLKKWDLARNALEQALEIDPNHRNAQANLKMLELEEQGIESGFEGIVKQLMDKVKEEAAEEKDI